MDDKITESVIDISIPGGEWVSVITKEYSGNTGIYYLFDKYKIYTKKIKIKKQSKKYAFKFPKINLLNVRQNGIYEEYLLLGKILIYKREREFWSDKG